jgi:hypothetical protein
VSFDELLELLRSFLGKPISISVDLASFESEPHDIASFSGVVDAIVEGKGGGGGIWRVWLKRDQGPGPDCLTLDRRLFLDADFEADREEADQAPVDASGMTWTLRIIQPGVRVEIIVYV